MPIARLFLFVPLINQPLHYPSHLKEFFLVIYHLFAGVTRNRVFLLEEDGLLGAHLFAQATIDAADHVDLELLGALLDFCPGIRRGDFFRHDSDCTRWTDEFTKLTGYTTFLAVFILNQCRSTAIPWGKLGVPALFGILHCHLGLARDELPEMLQSDRQPGGDRGQVELFGETQFGTFDDHLPCLL